jgi:hypothetical protein
MQIEKDREGGGRVHEQSFIILHSAEVKLKLKINIQITSVICVGLYWIDDDDHK